MSSTKPTLEIALALCIRDGSVLVTRRKAGAHLGGFWEFPGGKREVNETLEACALRELEEETGVTARAVRALAPIPWEYGERRVVLHPIECAWLAGEGALREVADVRWVRGAELLSLAFPPANAELVSELARTLAAPGE